MDPAAEIAARRAKNNAVKPGPGFVEPEHRAGGSGATPARAPDGGPRDAGGGPGAVTPRFHSLDGTRKMSANFRLYKKTALWDADDSAPKPPAYTEAEKRAFITQCVGKGMGNVAVRAALVEWAQQKEEEQRINALMGTDLGGGGGGAGAEVALTPRQERVKKEMERNAIGGRSGGKVPYDADAWEKAFQENAAKAAFYKKRNEEN